MTNLHDGIILYIGHACPVQRSYELFLRVVILLSHIFFYLPPAHLYLCLVNLVGGCISSIHFIICFFSFSSLFTVLYFLFWPPRSVIARANAQLSRILRSLIFFWRISLVRGVILLFAFSCLQLVCSPGGGDPVHFFCFVYLGFFNGKAERSKGYMV